MERESRGREERERARLFSREKGEVEASLSFALSGSHDLLVRSADFDSLRRPEVGGGRFFGGEVFLWDSIDSCGFSLGKNDMPAPRYAQLCLTCTNSLGKD